ncbi:hypothetical protein EVJ58_g47 [Rhodofomes roseus]|uniref:Homoserine kinase n=1 Tax=Rhodofomes roseus TaxID=34475 RepID=A0A4Y9Z9N4_9APHY|nr:hypothetical protein EVJ58_g47 [Rhodofomes roseus]
MKVSAVLALSLATAALALPRRLFPRDSGFALQNGQQAIAQNAQFATLTANLSCETGTDACVEQKFAQCVSGSYVLQSCGSGEICAALPLVNSAGTSITCTTQDDLQQRIAATGASNSTSSAVSSGVPTATGVSSVVASASSGGAASATSASASAPSSTASSSGNDTASQSSLTLLDSLVNTGFSDDGTNAASPEAGEVASLTSANNFINYCATLGLPLTNGDAGEGGLVQRRADGRDRRDGRDADREQLNASTGLIMGHSHVVIEEIQGMNQTDPTDPTKFAFFSGLNAVAENGQLTATVNGGLPKGTYRMASINAAANHQPVLVAVAQHGALDDMIYDEAQDTLEKTYGALDGEARAFLKRRTGIQDEEQLKAHILQVQTDAFAVHKYRCVQNFSFLKLKISRLPAYGQLLKLGREREGAVFLDIGCCFGNDIRKAVADGFPMENAIGSDLYAAFWELGHKLFNDSPETFPVPFLAGDAFSPAFLQPSAPFSALPSTPARALKALTTLTPLLGHVSAIHASSFFHLFNEAQQAAPRARARRPALARAGLGHLRLARRAVEEGPEGARSRGGLWRTEPMWCHDPESWEALWDGEVFERGTPATSMSRSFTIRVPATSANIGPGFDVVGLSLSLYLTLSVTITAPSSPSAHTPPSVRYTGEGADEVPLDAYKNLTTRVALYVLRCHGISSFPSALSIHAHNEIPFGRGLGSSGAAVVAGVLLGSALGGLRLPRARVLDFALMVERHPDNVTAALVGGFVGSYLRELDAAATEAASVPLSEVLPEYPPDAGEHWGRDPPQPPVGDWPFCALWVVAEHQGGRDHPQVFNLQRLAVLTTALAQSPPDPELIYEAMKDRIHQPYRKELIPGLPEVTSRMTPSSHPGLLGICLSGAGPTILALATSGFESIAEDARAIFREKGVEVDWKLLSVVGGSVVEGDDA